MKPLNPGQHVEAMKRANGIFTKDGTFVGLDTKKTDAGVVQAYQDYCFEVAKKAGLDDIAANLYAITQSERFTEQLPALKVLFNHSLR